MTFLWLATHNHILIFSNLTLHNFILVSKSNSSVYNKFTRHEQVLTWRVNLLHCVMNTEQTSYLSFSEFDAPSWKMNLRQYQTYNAGAYLAGCVGCERTALQISCDLFWWNWNLKISFKIIFTEVITFLYNFIYIPMINNL